MNPPTPHMEDKVFCGYCHKKDCSFCNPSTHTTEDWRNRFREEFYSGFHWKNIDGQDTRKRVEDFLEQEISAAIERTLRNCKKHD